MLGKVETGQVLVRRFWKGFEDRRLQERKTRANVAGDVARWLSLIRSKATKDLHIHFPGADTFGYFLPYGRFLHAALSIAIGRRGEAPITLRTSRKGLQCRNRIVFVVDALFGT